MPIGETTLLLVGLDTAQPGSDLMESLLRRAEAGESPLLDFLVVSRHTARRGSVREIAHDEFALAGLTLQLPGLIGLDDVALLAARIAIGTSAAIVLVESPVGASASVSALLRHRIIVTRSVPAVVTNALLESGRPPAIAQGGRRGCARVCRPHLRSVLR